MTGVEFVAYLDARLRFEGRQFERRDRAVFVVGYPEIEFRHQRRAVGTVRRGVAERRDQFPRRRIEDLQAFLAVAEKQPVRAAIQADIVESRGLALDRRGALLPPAVEG